MPEDSNSEIAAPNPYESPVTSAVSFAASSSQHAEPEIRSLSVWQLILAVCMLFMSVFFFIYMAFIVSALFGAGFNAAGGAGSMEWQMLVGIGSYFAIMLAWCVLPAIMLLRSSFKAKAFANGPDATSLNHLLKAQLQLWRSIGILMIVSILGMLTLFVFSMEL